MRKLLTSTALTFMLTLGAASQAASQAVSQAASQGSLAVTQAATQAAIQAAAAAASEAALKAASRSSDLNPEGDGSDGAVSTSRVKEALDAAMRNGGGAIYLETDSEKTAIGLDLVGSGQSKSIIPVHNPSEALAYDFEGEGGGTGGLDLNGGSIAEQIKRNGKNNHGNDDGDGSSNRGIGYDEPEFGGAPADPELVNPVPETFLLKQQESQG